MGTTGDHASVGDHATVGGHNIQNSTIVNSSVTMALRDPSTFPRQLPRPVDDFTGRDAEVERLVGLADAGAAVVVTAIEGTAGVGKTALAVHAAHQVKDRFPDGQLYADLLGYTVGRTPTPPGEVVEGFLRSLGVPAEDIPAHTDARAAAFRDVVSRRRLLVVLDNARHEGQIRPLLPASGSSLVIVTSRTVLAGLDGVLRLPLDVLTEDEALALLATTVGGERVASEPAAAREVVASCGRLPLAVRIAGRLLETDPDLTVADLAQALGDERERLAELAVGDLAVRSAFELSHRALSGDLSRMFSLIGLHPCQEISADAAAALCGDLTSQQAGRLLRDLRHAHLLELAGAGRYRTHDLIRLFAADCAEQDFDPDERDHAFERLVSSYVAAARQAIDDEAMDWLEVEREVLEVLRDAVDHVTDGVPDERSAWLDLALATGRNHRLLRERWEGRATLESWARRLCGDAAELALHSAVRVHELAVVMRRAAAVARFLSRVRRIYKRQPWAFADMAAGAAADTQRIAVDMEDMAKRLVAEPRLAALTRAADEFTRLADDCRRLAEHCRGARDPFAEAFDKLAQTCSSDAAQCRGWGQQLDRMTRTVADSMRLMGESLAIDERWIDTSTRFAARWEEKRDPRRRDEFRQIARAWRDLADRTRQGLAELRAASPDQEG
ncbi:NB-ARC domain-containing protein [Kutzneria buriramensis]|uniref:NB-ARC domain-containing protein n=1 Tax=Kutzneria buriramensis TaxID=1045776 RepID=A0A3E0I071_9PSEU|nr:NB-ARC domain-containing protein [Kutzneria buriramensis]